MSKSNRIIVVAVLICAVAVVLATNRRKPEDEQEPVSAQVVATETTNAVASDRELDATEPLPRLVDLGAGKCIPCKLMAPILEDLKEKYAGEFDVEFIDVWENPEAGEGYGIRVIPTQIFYDAAGKELFRHEGFFGKAEILATWKEYGVDVNAAADE